MPNLALGQVLASSSTLPEDRKLPLLRVSELSSINSQSWSWQALAQLHQQYQCLKIEPSIKPMLTRSEFALLLRQCLTHLQPLLSQLTPEELATLQRLKQEFAEQLNATENAIARLENQVENLEKQSFSPDLELEGEAILALARVYQDDEDNNLALGTRLRLSLETRVTGKDKLRIRIQARDIPEFAEVVGSDMANLGFDGQDDNELEVDEIRYQLALDQKTLLSLYAVGGGLGDLIPTVNPLFSSSGNGAISTFGRENPIRRQAEGSAVSLSYDFSEKVNLTLGYVSNSSNQPDRGVFNSPYAAIAQLTFRPQEELNFSLTYGYSANNVGTGTGSAIAENPFADSENVRAHSYGAEVAISLNPNLTLGGRLGWIQASARDLPDNPRADVFTWAVLLGITDFVQEDSLLGVVFGQPPKAIFNSLGTDFEDPDTAYHLEMFYRWQLEDDISITPGFFVVLNPEHNNNQAPILVGTIRTTFQF